MMVVKTFPNSFEDKKRIIDSYFPYYLSVVNSRRIVSGKHFSDYVWYGQDMCQYSHRVFQSDTHQLIISRLKENHGKNACVFYHDAATEIRIDVQGQWLLSYNAVAFQDKENALMFKLAFS